MNGIIRLSERMQAVADMVEPCKVACDIGCDHGYVSIYLAQTNKADKVIACDVNKGPLEACKANAAAAGLGDRIETRLGDGLHKVEITDKPETVVIAGMGGRLMERILSESIDIVRGVYRLVLQPQSEMFLVRKWLRDNGFTIIRERMLCEAGKYYWVINAINARDSKKTDSEILDIYDKYSGYLIENADVVLEEYLKHQLEVCESYLSGIESNRREGLLGQIGDIEKALNLIDRHRTV